MASILLGGKLGGEALVDHDDLGYLAANFRPSWRRDFRDYVRGEERGVIVGRKMAYLHRAIMERYEVIPPGLEVDHIDGNRLDNRRVNLRVVTHEQNTRNRKKNRGAQTSQYKGVYRFRNGWRVKIQQEHIGTFPTELEAARVYDGLAQERFGEYAKLNFPVSHDSRDDT